MPYQAKILVTLWQMRATIRNIELLAPARDLLSAVDAIDCGADAVYIGAGRFGARYAATNTTEDIAKVVQYAHRYGVKVYVTLNTLIFEDELAAAKQQAEELVAIGVDALIVQDMAYCRMGLNVALHASTQTACSSVEQVAFFEQVGFARAILERNLSKEQIAEIGNRCNIEIEAFIHGAICVCHSGRCYLSRSMSNRSGNRGQCSQPCRLPYDLTDGKGRVYIKGKHLLSVRDLDLSAHIGDMIDCGVNSFKIEGRLKDRIYLRNIVSHYRCLLDEQIALRSHCRRASAGISTIEFTPNPTKSFTRGGSEYLFCGKSAGVASFDTPKAMGERIGTVTRVTADSFILDSSVQLATGDGICFIANNEAVGTNINGINGSAITPNSFEGIKVGTVIYRNYDRLFTSTVERSRIRRAIEAKIAVKFTEHSISATAVDSTGISVSVTIDYNSEPAKNIEKMESVVREQMSKSGQTMFDIKAVEISSVRFVPASILSQLRRQLLTALEHQRVAVYPKSAIFVENLEARFPSESITEQENVTNTLSRNFYADHGVNNIAEGLDLRQNTKGCRVMITDYCIRREIGQCLLNNPTIKGDIYLERGAKRYKLTFDCSRCQMSIYDTI